MAFTLDASAHLTALRTLLEVEADGFEVLGYDEPHTTATYIRVSIERRFIENQRGLCVNPTSGWRVTAVPVSTTIRNVEKGLTAVTAAWDECTVTVAASPSTPLQFESSNSPQPDGDASSATAGPFAGSATYTYVHN